MTNHEYMRSRDTVALQCGVAVESHALVGPARAATSLFPLRRSTSECRAANTRHGQARAIGGPLRGLGLRGREGS